ncbi:hypothetical protein [Rhodococcus sp. 11-3]|uniref:hypothetical protein n=1 Tax=Rhodococcus sp. 11-3 TaxID=2854796 RepID=UPI00203BF134|nr:hypothetical protein [Rhodococcus sp. 11-3]USC17002.1 hypothetical protein KZJ41_09110 [Rhodococcus sp. 11-3]
MTEWPDAYLEAGAAASQRRRTQEFVPCPFCGWDWHGKPRKNNQGVLLCGGSFVPPRTEKDQ